MKRLQQRSSDLYRPGDRFGAEDAGSMCMSKRRNIMLEKDSWSHSLLEVFPSSIGGNSNKEAAIECNDADEFCADGSILDDKADAVDNNCFDYILDDITNPNLDFFDNTGGKDSSDLLYYGWLEIGNFEDVDRIFRSCDSTFGLGPSKNNEPDWFLTQGDTCGSGELGRASLKTEHPEFSMVDDILKNNVSSKSYNTNDSPTRTAPISSRGSSWNSDISVMMEDNKYEFFPNEQINESKKESKLQKLSTGKRKDQNVKSDRLKYVNSLASGGIQQPYKATSYQTFQSFPNGHQGKASDLSSSNYLHSSISFVGSDNIRLSEASAIDPTKSAVSSQDHDLNPSSTVDPPCQDTGLSVGGKRDKLFNVQGIYLSENHSLTRKQIYYSEKKFENQNDNPVASLGILDELGSCSNTQEEGMAMDTAVQDISSEASSFHQLQHAMEKLDARTKLCIRDSLYRLARSAEQRHNSTNPIDIHLGNDQYVTAHFLPDEANSFMNIETHTNAMDRSVAHLLFHRPPESFPVPPAHNTSPDVKRGSGLSPPDCVDQRVSCPEVASESGKTEC